MTSAIGKIVIIKALVELIHHQQKIYVCVLTVIKIK